MKVIVAFGLTLSLLVGTARADYVEVRRSAAIRSQPDGQASVLATPAIGTHLILFAAGQSNSYYHIIIPSSLGATASDGYIFRNRVRGFPGDPPDTEIAAAATAVPATSSTTTSNVVYGGLPKNEFAEYPIKILDKGFYVVGYSEDFMNPAWVSYHISGVQDFHSFPRPGFRTDESTVSRVRTQDYPSTGFSRGHMAPNFAMGSRFGADGARSTFVMSNVCPQFQSFNDAQWGDLEEWIAGRKPPHVTAATFIRGWADVYGEVWVTVGPIFDEDRDPLPCGVPVPNAFFCIVVDENNGSPRCLAFIMPHQDQRISNIRQYLTTVDDIEARAGLDFFSALPDPLENAMESTKAPDLWPVPVAPH